MNISDYNELMQLKKTKLEKIKIRTINLIKIDKNLIKNAVKSLLQYYL